MSLLEEFVNKSPNGYEDYPNHDEIADEVGATCVHTQVVDTTRWGYIDEYVYQREDEYVRVVFEVGSGDSDVPYEPEFTEVVPVEKTITEYEVK